MSEPKRQTAVLVSTHGGQPATLPVSATPGQIAQLIREGSATFLVTTIPDSDSQVCIRISDIIAFWDQQVIAVNDPRVLGMQQTPSGIQLPDSGFGKPS